MTFLFWRRPIYGWRGFLSRILDRFRAPTPRLGTVTEGSSNPACESDPRLSADGAQAGELDHMAWMLDDVLEQARHGRAPRTEPVDVRALLARIVARHDPARLQLAPAPWPLFVLATPPALERVFEVLLRAALANSTRARIRLDRGTCAMVAHVDDEGPGVPRHMRHLLFAPSAANRGGSGALATARGIARAMQGDITVSSSPEGGARFTVRLPILPDDMWELAAAS